MQGGQAATWLPISRFIFNYYTCRRSSRENVRLPRTKFVPLSILVNVLACASAAVKQNYTSAHYLAQGPECSSTRSLQCTNLKGKAEYVRLLDIGFTSSRWK
jgi:hypothetical protein